MSENQLAENLTYYRKKKGLSQEKVSEYLDVSRQAVTKWEANTSRPSADHLIRLAQLFEVDVDTLLGNGDRGKSSAQGEVYSVYPDTAISAYLFFQCNKK